MELLFGTYSNIQNIKMTFFCLQVTWQNKERRKIAFSVLMSLYNIVTKAIFSQPLAPCSREREISSSSIFSEKFISAFFPRISTADS